jgi:hypothetical protein
MWPPQPVTGIDLLFILPAKIQNKQLWIAGTWWSTSSWFGFEVISPQKRKSI